MTTQAPFKTYRVYFGVVSVLILAVGIGLVANFWAFFNTGADRATALNLPPDLPESHVPLVRWLPDDANTGRPMEDFTRRAILKDYLRGWYQQEIALLTANTEGLREYFTPSAFSKVVSAIGQPISAGFRIHQTDLEHHIRLHFYSADGQIVSFTDQRTWLKKRLYLEQQRFGTLDELADYDVVMMLDDGYWRVKNWVRKPPSVLASDSTSPAPSHLVRVNGTQFILDDQPFVPRGVNYYPAQSPWSAMWTHFNPTAVRQDFELVRSLGFNTIRIFVNFHDFGKGIVLSERLGQLKQVLDLAQQSRLKVIVTLFDFLGDYRLSNFSATDRQLESLLTAFNQHEAIMAWDLKNEPDLDFKHHHPTDVQEWLRWIVERAKHYDPHHLLTVGWAYPENAHLLSDVVDFVAFHSYKSPQVLATGLDALRSKVKDKPLLLEEFGLPTYRGLWAPLGHGQDAQAAYFAEVRQVLRQRGDIPFVVWTLHDFVAVPAEVVGAAPWNREPQKHFGIIDNKRRPKKGLAVLQK